MNQYDYIDAGLRVFGLYGADKEGNCECGYDKCEAAFKHPRSSNWQHTPDWSDEQLEVMEELGHFNTGFGVLVQGLLIVDVDARNGGVKSFNRLCKDLSIDLLGECGFAVSTGSGGGSMHLYFKAPNAALMQHHNNYKGIDFKSTGYVVGAGSLHASGNIYEEIHGHPCDISDAPDTLLKLLTKPDKFRARTSLGEIDVSTKEVEDILSYIDPDIEYDTWIRCGMAIHETLNGTGFEIWDEWSRKGRKYSGLEQTEKHWHSFGKSADPVALGTLIHYAEQNGYKQPVTFQYEEQKTYAPALDISGIDLNRPPSFVGELTQWINDQCLYPRESLAVATALTAVSSIAGMRVFDEKDGMTANLFCFCVAGSSTGKEAVQKAYNEIMKAAGVTAALHGAIKSEQEIIRNLTRHQASFYCIDEMGIVLRKIMNAGNRGGASYLEGVIGLIMSVYSKADSFLPVSGDVKEAIRKDLSDELARCKKKVDENEDKTGKYAKRIESIEHGLKSIDRGIERPFLSILGFTTPVTFNALMEYEVATNGFLSRAMIFEETDNNPKRKKGFKRRAMPDPMKYAIRNLYKMGEYDMLEGESRVEHYEEQSPIATDKHAEQALDDVYQAFWEMAEQAQGESGLEAIPRRGYELVAKISFILGIPEGVRTKEHVLWAYALVKRDIERKMQLAFANMSEKDSPADAIAVKIQSFLTNSDKAQTAGVIVNRCRPHKKEDVLSVLDALESKKLIKMVETKRSKAYCIP